MTNRILIALVLLGGGALSYAQESQKDTQARKAAEEKRKDAEAQRQVEATLGKGTVALFHLKYADPETASRLLSNAGVSVTQDRTLHVVVISGSEDRVTRAEKVLQEIDVPSSAGVSPSTPPVPVLKDLEFTIYLVAGEDKGETSVGVPKQLEDTITQIRALFPFASYRLLDTAVDRVSEDGVSEVHGFLRSTGASAETANYSISISMRGIASREHERQISVREFRCAISFLGEVDHSRNDVLIRTELDLKEGQQVVVGKASAGTGRTVFVIVSARVL